MRAAVVSIFVAIVVALLLYGVVVAVAECQVVDGWCVGKEHPTAIGPLVAEGTKADPGGEWSAPADGRLQKVLWDNDPKCEEKGAVTFLRRLVGGEVERYVVPRAPFRNDNCNDTVQALYTSRTFAVAEGDVAYVEFGGDSGHYYFYFVEEKEEPTPTPTLTSTPTVPPTQTPVPTVTETPLPTATNTPLPTATATATPLPTETPVPNEPREPSACLRAWTVPPLPEALPLEGVVADVYVDAINPEGYAWYDGAGWLYFDEQPLRGIRFLPQTTYRVTVGTEDFGCSFAAAPTGLKEGEQPQMPYSNAIRLPLVGG